MLETVYISRRQAIDALGAKYSSLIPRGEQVPVETVAAVDMLTPARLDIAVKVEHARWRLKGIDSGFSRDLYLDHIRVFNGFFEADSSKKLKPDGFLRAFDVLLESMQSDGFSENSLVPISLDGVVLDGAHRVACAIVLGVPIRVVRTNVTVGPRFNAMFFESRGMSATFVDAALDSYTRLKTDTRLVLIWPTAQGRDSDMLNIVQQHADVIGRKDVFLSRRGAVQFMMRTYKTEPWLGSAADDYIGARNKAQWCFQGSGPLRVLLVRPHASSMIECKEAVRRLFNKERHSVHMNDTHGESVELAAALFNSNSIHFMNHAPAISPPWFSRLFDHYDSWLRAEHETDADLFCLDGSSVLAAYGVRDVRDLDFLFAGPTPPSTGFKEISAHTDAEQLYRNTVDDLVFNPTKHFYYRDRKMITLDVLRDMKVRRGEVKDGDDLVMLESSLSHGRVHVPRTFMIRRALRPTYIKGRIKLVALKVRYHVAVFRHREHN